MFSMKEVTITEKLNSSRNEMTHLLGSIFVTFGSSIAILFNNPNIIMCIFGVVGIILALSFLNAYFVRRMEVLKLIKNLENQ